MKTEEEIRKILSGYFRGIRIDVKEKDYTHAILMTEVLGDFIREIVDENIK
jgi:hypothetical protein